MATDFTDEKFPNDDPKASDSHFQNDTSNNGNPNPPELNYTEPTEGELQLKAMDDEIKRA